MQNHNKQLQRGEFNMADENSFVGSRISSSHRSTFGVEDLEFSQK